MAPIVARWPLHDPPPPPPDPGPQPNPAAAVPPWSWPVAELGLHLTEAQRQTVLARFRALKFDATTWQYPTTPS
jgi:hypothetical protein